MMEDVGQIKEAAVRMALHCGKIQMESFRTQNIGIDTKRVARDLNKAILLSTHDIDHAKRFGDEAWMMDKKQLRCSSFKELIAEKPDFFLSEEELFNLFLA